MPGDSLDLLPDDDGEALVRELWSALGDAGLPSRGDHRSASNRPHVTLATASDHDREGFDEASVAAVVRRLGPVLPAAWEHAGVALLGVRRLTVSWLLAPPPEVAAAVARARARLGGTPRPWLAHLTLADRVPREQVARALDVLGELGEPPRRPPLTITGLSHWRPHEERVDRLI